MMKHGNLQQALIWNMGGICFYFLCRWLVNIFAVRMSDDFTSAGLLALAISITNIWVVVALFSVRNIQVSDVETEYSDNDYVSFRIVTILIATVLCVINAALFTRNVYHILVIFVYMLIVAGNSYADVTHGILQKHWRMDIIGTSFVLKGIVIFLPFLLFFRTFGLLFALIVTAFLYFIVIIVFDNPFARKYTSIKVSFDWQRILTLVKICFPLVICSFFSLLIPSLTRMALERMTDIETLGLFGSVTLPATIIQTVVASAFAPFVSKFTQYYNEADYKKFTRLFWLGISGILTFFVVFYLLTLPLGEWIINLLFGRGTGQYVYLFREAAVNSFLLCLSLYVALPLIIFRYIKTQLVIYTAGIVMCVILIRPMIEQFGMSGANYVQIISYGIILSGLLIATVISSKKSFTKKLSLK